MSANATDIRIEFGWPSEEDKQTEFELSELARELDASARALLLPTPAVYEIVAGLRFSRSRLEARAFQDVADTFPRAAFDEDAAHQAGEIRAELLRLGRPKAHTDVMIAGIAKAGGHELVTCDEDFQQIADAVGLRLTTYD